MPATLHIAPQKVDPRGGALDLLRFLAAAFIVLYHYGSEAPVALDHLAPAFSHGWLATDFFLILSGYVLGRAYGGSLDQGHTTWPSFFARRLARIWPAHLMVLAGLLLLVAIATVTGVALHTPQRFHAAEFFEQAALLQAWGVTHQQAWNEPTWTLSALVVCYAAFPLVWWLCQPLKGRVAAIVAGLAVVLAGAAFSLGALGLSLYDLPFHHGVVRALPLFILGMMLARFASERRWPASAAWMVAGLAALTLIGLQTLPRSELTAFGSIAAIAAVVLAADSLPLRGGSLVRAGADLSFALFITHAVTGALWFGAVSRLGLSDNWLAFALAFPFALTGAFVFHHLFDTPVQRRLKAMMARRPATAPVVEPA